MTLIGDIQKSAKLCLVSLPECRTQSTTKRTHSPTWPRSSRGRVQTRSWERALSCLCSLQKSATCLMLHKSDPRRARFFYMGTAKSFACLGYPLLRPDYDDFRQTTVDDKNKDNSVNVKCRTGRTAMPKELNLSFAMIQANVKKAGTFSNHRMAAATAWVLANAAADFRSADRAWTGQPSRCPCIRILCVSVCVSVPVFVCACLCVCSIASVFACCLLLFDSLVCLTIRLN